MGNPNRKGKTLEQEYGIEKAKEIRLRLSNSHKGKEPSNKGLKMPSPSKETIEKRKIGIKNAHQLKEFGFKKGHKVWNKDIKGIHLSSKSEFKRGYKPWNTGIKGSMSGIKNGMWKGEILPERKRLYFTEEYKNWRSSVFQRDNWTCQTCGKRGCILEAHHINEWCNYPELRFEISNGVTLCQECHNLTKKGRRKLQS